MLAVQWLMRKRAYVGTLRFLLTLGLLWGYCAVVGSPAPAVRACVMMSIYVLAQWAGWQYDLLTALCFAAALIVFVRPAQLFAAGFCLSFTATAGIALYYKGFAARLMRVRRMPKKLAQGIAVYAAAQIGILPASIWFFSQIQPYGLLGNLIIVPLSGIVTVGGLLSAALGALWLGAGRVVAYPVGVACAGMEWLARALAAMPLAQLGISGLKFLHVALFYFGAAALSRYCLIGRGGKRALAVGVGAAMLATAMLPF
jgi:competence protein ComEC